MKLWNKKELVDIKKVTVGQFKDCLVHSDYSSLVVKGDFTPEELAKKWQEIYTYYSELTGDSKQTQEYVYILKQFAESQSRYIALHAAIKALSTGYNKEAEEVINSLGYNTKFDGLKMDEYMNELERNMKRLKGVTTSLKVARATLDDYLKKKQKWDEKKFSEFLAAVSKFIGFPVTYDTLLINFASYVNLMQKHG
jgi:hypothetical protein